MVVQSRIVRATLGKLFFHHSQELGHRVVQIAGQPLAFFGDRGGLRAAPQLVFGLFALGDVGEDGIDLAESRFVGSIVWCRVNDEPPGLLCFWS